SNSASPARTCADGSRAPPCSRCFAAEADRCSGPTICVALETDCAAIETDPHALNAKEPTSLGRVAGMSQRVIVEALGALIEIDATARSAASFAAIQAAWAAGTSHRSPADATVAVGAEHDDDVMLSV